MTGTTPLEEIEHTVIPMSDGCGLAARIWLPADAGERPVPAILEYIPYRKRDFTAIRDSQIHRFFARHGYACVRVDLRGSGDSEGVLEDEYLEAELSDGVEVIRWIGEQRWCTGKVGMIGLSWGGFNGLQIAARRPPELAAVVSVCSSDDRYADDVHFMGGCLLTDNLSWASNMFAYNACPPDPALVGERWRSMWLERLEGSGLWVDNWTRHQTRDAFWKHASVCEDYSSIECPVYAVSGWADGYSNTVFRLLENLDVPTKGLVGAWGHKYPHMGKVGPPIGFLSESLRWWDRWLKGEDNGIEKEPRLRVWMQDATSPIEVQKPGRWVAEDAWPSPRLKERRLHLGAGVTTLSETPESAEGALEIQSPLSVGLFAGKWYSYAAQTDLPSDQREEDGGALVFETAPLSEPLEILGAPELELELASSEPVAMVAVRLSDVHPSGPVTRVTYGLLNLTHRDSHEHPEPLEVKKRYRATVPLNGVAQRFESGHKLRLSISTSYWPLAWPAPRSPRLTVYTGASVLRLPERPPRASDVDLPDFPPPEDPEPMPYTLLEPPRREWQVTHNLAANESALEVINNDMRFRIEDYDLEVHRQVEERYSYRNYRYDTLKGEVRARRIFRRGAWEVETLTRTVMTATETHFRITATLDAYEGDRRVFSLRRLRTDYIDLLWVHAWDRLTPYEETMRGLDDLVRSGKVLYVGVSDTPAWVVSASNTLAELRGWSAYVGLQIEYSLLERTVERELLPMAEHFGLSVLAWAPLGAGVLTGKYTRGGDNDSLRASSNEQRGRTSEQALRIARAVDEVADELGVSSAQVATAWVSAQSYGCIPIVGARKVEQIQDTLGAASVKLEPSHLEKLDAPSKPSLGFPMQFLGSDGVLDLVESEQRGRITRPGAHRRG